VQKGTVKWFNPTKGYGFIRPSTGEKDVFVHISAVERAGLSTLNEGQTVEYELVTNRGKTSAENLKVAYAILPGFAPVPGLTRSPRLTAGGFSFHSALDFWNDYFVVGGDSANDYATSVDQADAILRQQPQCERIDPMLDGEHARREALRCIIICNPDCA